MEEHETNTGKNIDTDETGKYKDDMQVYRNDDENDLICIKHMNSSTQNVSTSDKFDSSPGQAPSSQALHVKNKTIRR